MKNQGIKSGTICPIQPDPMKRESPQPQQSQSKLKARALALAQPPEQVMRTECLEVVTFLLAYETYGIETVCTRAVYPLKDLTQLPCTPSFVAGIVNVRGQIISVIDIKMFFDLPEKGLTDLNKLIILSNGMMEFGILADAILDVRNIPLEKIQFGGLPTLTGIHKDYLRGVTADGLVILDAAKLLTDCNLIVHEKIA